MATLTPFKVACAQAKALAMATGKVTSVHANNGAPLVVTKLVKPSFTSMEVQGNTADDRAANNWSEADYEKAVLEAERVLQAQCDRDAKWYAGWYLESHTATCASIGTARRIAKAKTTDKSPARIKRVKTAVQVGFAPDATWPEGRSWTVQRTSYEVAYTTKVCYAVDGDVDHVAEERVVEYDEAGPAWESDVSVAIDTEFHLYPEWEPVAQAHGFGDYLAKVKRVVRRPHSLTIPE